MSAIYAAPNLFGDVPAVQVSAQRGSLKVDEALRSSLDEALKAAAVPPTATELQETFLRFRFATADAQFKANDVVRSKLPPGYGAAMTLVPNSPQWLLAIGSKPMNLGLDLRGGVHYLLQVDIAAASNKFFEGAMNDARSLR